MAKNVGFFVLSSFAIIEKIPSSHCVMLRCNYQEKYLFTLLISLDMSRLCNKTQWMPHIPSAGSILSILGTNWVIL